MSFWQASLWSAAWIAGAALVAQVVHRLVLVAFGRLARHTAATWDNAALRELRGPSRLAITLVAILFVAPSAPLGAAARAALQHLVGLGLIGCIAWTVVGLVNVLEDILRARYRTDVPDNLEARAVVTQVQVLRRVVLVVVSVLAVAVALMTFPTIRHVGTSLLASAGLAGLVVGMAMRPTLANLLAGVQIALTQPIRLQDVVIVEGEWGWIEEIGSTYVVVKIWDLRRLVLPLSYFVEQPFQNWTRTTANLLGTVFLYVDYTVSVDALRAELRRILEATPLWLGQVCVLQVSDARERVLELRALFDVKDSGAAWDLRCLVRERLIAYLQQHRPDVLPRARVVLEPDRGSGGRVPLGGLERGTQPA